MNCIKTWLYVVMMNLLLGLVLVTVHNCVFDSNVWLVTGCFSLLVIGAKFVLWAGLLAPEFEWWLLNSNCWQSLIQPNGWFCWKAFADFCALYIQPSFHQPNKVKVRRRLVMTWLANFGFCRYSSSLLSHGAMIFNLVENKYLQSHG